MVAAESAGVQADVGVDQWAVWGAEDICDGERDVCEGGE
jgi:hypothetical protein